MLKRSNKVKQGIKICLASMFLLGGSPSIGQEPTNKNAKSIAKLMTSEYLDELRINSVLEENFGEDYEGIEWAFGSGRANSYREWKEKNKIRELAQHVEQNADSSRDNTFTKRIGKYSIRLDKGKKESGLASSLEIMDKDGNTFVDKGLDGFGEISRGDRWSLSMPGITRYGITGEEKVSKLFGGNVVPYHDPKNLEKVQRAYMAVLESVIETSK